MKDAFKEFARLNKQELQEFFNGAIIVFDTNVLLHLYLFSAQTLKKVFNMLTDIKKQLWMPHKVGEEFYHNRAKQIEFLKTQEKLIFDALDNDLHKTYGNVCFYAELEKGINDIKDNIKHIVETHKKQYDKDEIADKLEDLFNGKVGKKYSEERINELNKQYCDNIKNEKDCPGTKDSKKTTNYAGDYIIWNQIIDEAKRINKNVIFVTDDQKKDWWQLTSEQTIAARPELLTEFKESTAGKLIKMYTLDGFISMYNSNKKEKIDKLAAEEIKSKIARNEQFLKNLQPLQDVAKRFNALGSNPLVEILKSNQCVNTLNSAKQVSKLSELLKALEPKMPKYDSYDSLKDMFETQYINDNNKLD